MDPAIARRWIVANAIPATIVACWGLASLVLRQWLELANPGMALGLRLSYATALLIIGIGTYALFAHLSGPVLRYLVPSLPQRGWLAIHLVIGLLSGGSDALLALAGKREPFDWSDVDAGFLVFIPFVIAAWGMLFGALFGAAQAIILRQAAEGWRSWIVVSAVAGTVWVLAIAIPLPFQPRRETLGGEVATEITRFIAELVYAVMMLPALARLRMRGGD